MSSLKVSNRGWVILTTVLFIGLAFALYFLVYVKKQEAHLSQEGFRVLRQITVGVNSLEETFLANARSIAQKPGSSADLNTFLQRSSKVEKNDPVRYEKDSLYFHVDGITINEVQEIIINVAPKETSQPIRTQNRNVMYSKFGDDTLEIVQSIARPRRTTRTVQKVTSADFRSSYDDFFGESKLNWRYDVFEHYMVLKVNPGDGQDIDYLYKTFLNEISFDSLNQAVGHGTLRSIFAAKISNVNYMVFNHVLDEDQNIYVSGLIRESAFNARKKSVSPTLLISAGLVILFILMSMPLLKLAFMSNEERLYSYNVVFVGISLSFGPAILLLLHFTLVNYFFRNYSDLDEELVSLSNNIETNFRREIATLNRQKQAYDSALYGAIESKFNLDAILETELAPKYYKFFNYGFWANDKGKVKAQLSTFENAPFSGDLSHRKYVTETLTNPYHINYQGEDIDFMIESIRSVSDGSFEAGVGFRSLLDTIVFAFSTKLNSVMDPVLEPGYGFCIFNEEGEVIFHSEITKNLNENFLEEIDYEPAFMSTMNSQVPSHETLRYGGKSNRIFVRPMVELPLYIVTFQDRQNYRTPLSQALITSFMLFLINYGALGIMLMILVIPNINRSKLEQSTFLFHWVRPIRNTHYARLYEYLFIVNLIAAFYMYLVGWLYSSMPIYTLINVVNILAIILVYCFKLLREPLPRAFNSSKADLNYFAPFLAIVPLVLQWAINPFGLANIVNSAAMIYALFWAKKESSESVPIDSKTFSRTYYKYVLSWLILISVVPSLNFYKISFRQELEIMSKYSLNEFLESYNEREETLHKEFVLKIPSSIDSIIASRENFGGYLYSDSDSIIFASTKDELPDCLTMDGDLLVMDNDSIYNDPKELAFSSIYYHLKPEFNQLITDSRGFAFSSSEDGSWSSCRDFGDLYLLKIFKKPSANLSLAGVSEVPVLFDSLTFWLLFVGGFVFIVILYGQTIVFSVRRMFGFDYISIADRRDTDIKNFIEHWHSSDDQGPSTNNLIVIGLHHSQKVKFVGDLLDNKQLKLNDFNEVDPKKEFSILDNGDDGPVIIEHFEYKFQDHEINQAKLKILQKLVNKEKNVVLTSEINPSQIFRFYDKNIQAIKDQIKSSGGNAELGKILEGYQSAYLQWQYVLGSFKKVYVPLNYKRGTRELDFGGYLRSMQGHYQQENGRSYEDRVIDIQVASHPYYHAIWNSLPKEERYIVYDLAKDSFLNANNTTSIVNLLKKGILVYDHSLRLMNDSFTNFVLTQVRKSEALEMELNIREKGSWNTISMVLMLVIISIVFFLSFGQQDFLDDINALLTALATVVGLAIRFGGIFSFGSGGKS